MLNRISLTIMVYVNDCFQQMYFDLILSTILWDNSMINKYDDDQSLNE